MTVAIIDVGQTGMRVDSGGTLHTRARGGEVLATGAAIDTLADDLVAAAPLARELRVGATGLPDHAAADRLAQALTNRGVRRALVASDRVTGHLGALGPGRGVTLTAGTGVVAFAVSATSSRTVGGAGWSVDDDGGGFWIGRQGLRAALRGSDGRGARTVLTARATARWGTPEHWHAAITATGAPVAAVAGFVPDIAAAAREGDAVARSLWDQATVFLAEVATAAWTSVAHDAGRIAVTGGLVGAGDVFTAPLTAHLGSDWSELLFVEDASLAGARLLADGLDDPAFSPHISISEAP